MAEPVLGPMEQTCRDIGHLIGDVLDEHAAEDNPESPRVGFCLMMFTFGEGGWATYVSNADRLDMIKAVEELLDRVRSDPRTPQASR